MCSTKYEFEMELNDKIIEIVDRLLDIAEKDGNVIILSKDIWKEIQQIAKDEIN